MLACNKLGEVSGGNYDYRPVLLWYPMLQAGGRLVQEGVEENKYLTHIDLRLTGVSAESEYCINQIIKNNSDSSVTNIIIDDNN